MHETTRPALRRQDATQDEAMQITPEAFAGDRLIWTLLRRIPV